MSARPPGTSNLDFIDPGDIPFLSSCPVFGRRIIPLPLHDGTRFHVFIPQPDDKLMVMQPIDMGNGHYVARFAASQADVHDALEEAVVQSFSYPKLIETVWDMHSDVQNALSSLHRYFVVLHHSTRYHDRAATHLIASELEYAFANHRAFFDLLAIVLHLFRTQPQFSKATLPNSFRKILQKNDDELLSRYGMPDQLVRFIRKRERLFFALRAIRDGIYHRGQSVDAIIFSLPDGFGVNTDSKFRDSLSEFSLWTEQTLKNGKIASLLPVFEMLARDLVETSDELAGTMNSLPSIPEPIALGYHVFLRSPLTFHIHNFAWYSEQHWLLPEQVLNLQVEGGAG